MRAINVSMIEDMLKQFVRPCGLGDDGDKELRNRIRAHGNFIENVPIALLLLLLNDLNGLGDSTLMILGSVLLVSRLIHYVMIVSRSISPNREVKKDKDLSHPTIFLSADSRNRGPRRSCSSGGTSTMTDTSTCSPPARMA